MTEKKERTQEVLSWVNRKIPRPCDILELVVDEHPTLLEIKVSKLLAIQWGKREWFKAFWASAMDEKYDVPSKNVGGELLTRLPVKIIERASSKLEIDKDSFIGRAFMEMSPKKMDKVLIALLKKQLEYIENTKAIKYFSVNVEAPVVNNDAWQEIIELFFQKSSNNVSAELIERREFPEFALLGLERICSKTGMHISIDDVGSGAHDLYTRSGRSYLKKVIEILGEHIVTYKVDYDIVRKMAKNINVAMRVSANLTAVVWLWELVHPGVPIGGVTLESMPRDDRGWLLLVEKSYSLFRELLWQKD